MRIARVAMGDDRPGRRWADLWQDGEFPPRRYVGVNCSGDMRGFVRNSRSERGLNEKRGENDPQDDQ